MDAHAKRDSLLDPQTERICRVCGHAQLDEDTPHEYAAGLTDRLICGNCGAHHLI